MDYLHDIKEYSEIFHRTLEEAAIRYLPEASRRNLFHISLLPAKIIWYVSHQNGIAVEYCPAQKTTNEVVEKYTARIEDMLLRAPRRIREGSRTKITVRGSSKVNIFGGFDDGLYPLRVECQNADISFFDAVYADGNWRREIRYAHIWGNLNPENWTKEKAVLSAMDEVVAAVVEIKRIEEKQVSLQEYIAKSKEKTVLVLGNYDDQGKTRIRSIVNTLRDLGYEAFTTEDIPDHPEQNLTQKVVTLASLSRFIIIDDTCPSGHLLEFSKCKENDWLTIVLHAEGVRGSWMTATGGLYSKVIREQDYDPASPQVALAMATSWAEGVLRDLKRDLSNSYPWRRVPEIPGKERERPKADMTIEATRSREEMRKLSVAKGREIGRNAPCPCGSGKKYKKCCGR